MKFYLRFLVPLAILAVCLATVLLGGTGVLGTAP